MLSLFVPLVKEKQMGLFNKRTKLYHKRGKQLRLRSYTEIGDKRKRNQILDIIIFILNGTAKLFLLLKKNFTKLNFKS